MGVPHLARGKVKAFGSLGEHKTCGFVPIRAMFFCSPSFWRCRKVQDFGLWARVSRFGLSPVQWPRLEITRKSVPTRSPPCRGGKSKSISPAQGGFLPAAIFAPIEQAESERCPGTQVTLSVADSMRNGTIVRSMFKGRGSNIG